MKLYPHQTEALEKTENLNKVAYYLDMGLGKTFVGSEKAMSFSESCILVVCQKSKIQDWIEHFKTYYSCNVDDLTEKNQLIHFLTYGSFEEKTKPHIVGVINYDLIFRRPDFLQLKAFTLVLDESSTIQNEKAKRSKFILKMKPKNVILLSGTPTAGKYEKLWSQLHLLGWDISKDLYYKQYVETEWVEDAESGFKIPVVVGYKNVERLKSKLAMHGAIFMKTDEVFDLPKQIEIPITQKGTREYSRFMRNSIVEIDGREFIGDTILSKRIYARMMCSYLNKQRIAAFSDLVESTDSRIIVFYNYNAELEVIRNIVNALEKPYSYLNGEGEDLTAYENEENSVTAVQYQAGAMGKNFQKANIIIYFSLTDRSELFEQSKKRIHRIGQSKNCFYYIMYCPNTVEEHILQTLRERKDYTDELFKAYQQKSDCKA